MIASTAILVATPALARRGDYVLYSEHVADALGIALVGAGMVEVQSD